MRFNPPLRAKVCDNVVQAGDRTRFVAGQEIELSNLATNQMFFGVIGHSVLIPADRVDIDTKHGTQVDIQAALAAQANIARVLNPPPPAARRRNQLLMRQLAQI